MDEELFSEWRPWLSRDDLDGLKYPGVYAISHTAEPLAHTPFSWRPDIIYIGMTNAVSGLKGRLKQFDNGIAWKPGHGGAERVRNKHREYGILSPRLYVAVAAFKCDVTSGKPSDLRRMGDVARFEYLCFAHFAEQFGKLPEFNNKKDSPKGKNR